MAGRINLQNLDLQFIADLHGVAGFPEARPGHVHDVQQSIHAAEIKKGAEVHDRPDTT